MPVEINENRDSFTSLAHKLLEEVNLRVNYGVWLSPSSVQVNASQGAAAIPDRDAVNVDHGQYAHHVIVK